MSTSEGSSAKALVDVAVAQLYSHICGVCPATFMETSTSWKGNSCNRNYSRNYTASRRYVSS